MADVETEYIQLKKGGDKYYFRDKRFNQLSQEIQNNSQNIETEIQRAKQAEETNSQKITDETNRAKQAEETNSQKITDETNRAKQEEQANADNISTNEQNITALSGRVTNTETRLAELEKYEIIKISSQQSIGVSTTGWSTSHQYLEIKSGIRSANYLETDELLGGFCEVGNAPGTSTDYFIATPGTESTPVNGQRYSVFSYDYGFQASSQPAETVYLPVVINVIVRRKKS